MNFLSKGISTRAIAGHSHKLTAVALVASFAVIGSALILSSHAAGPAVSSEPELGSVITPASVGSDTAASGGKYIKFAAATPTPPPPAPTPSPTPPPSGVSSSTPCVGAAAPAQWKHVVLVMFENHTYSSVIGSSAPFITGLATKCGTYASWKDANYRVDGSTDGNYVSKPHYATLTSGLPPSKTGIKDDSYGTTTSADNIFNRLNQMSKNTRSYVSGSGGSCSSSNFSGAYHDPMRYYTNLGGQSSSSSTYCNTHDVNISQFMTDVNAGNLPAFSIILPTNQQNMHDNSVSTGDSYAKSLLTPFLDSAQYKSGDTALFFLFDEDTPIPTALIAPSIKPGSKPVAPSSTQPIGHFSAIRTFQEMLGVSPLLGDSGQASSLLNFYNGR